MIDAAEGDRAPQLPRQFRIEDRFWYPAMRKAKAEGTTISAKIRGWIIRYLEDDER